GLVGTRRLWQVGAGWYDDAVAVAARLPTSPRVVSLDPSTLDDVLADLGRLADEAGVPDAGATLVADARRRLDRVRGAVADARRPRVVALEWLAPPMVGGHWVPEMIRLAG